MVENEVKLRFENLNLQYFNDAGTDDGSNTDAGTLENQVLDDQDQVKDDGTGDETGGAKTKTNTDAGDKNKGKDKLFTQEDVNNLVTRETRKAVEKLLKQLGVKDVKSAKEGLEQFRKQQEAQMTDFERVQKRAKELEVTNSELTGQVEALQAQLAALKADVKPESVEDVVVLAKNLVNDETSIDEAIKQVLKKYPHFKKQTQNTEPQKPTFTSGQHKNGVKKPDEKDAWMQAFNWTNQFK